MDFETLHLVTRSYRNRSIDDFLADWRALVDAGEVPAQVLRVNVALVDAYVARLAASGDPVAVLTELKTDRHVRGRECIAIAERLTGRAGGPRSRNRALHTIEAYCAAHRGR